MRIVGIGAGPASLYFGILMKQALPSAEIELFERNAVGETFGWGVVFSDETLGHFEVADPESYADIVRRFAYWTDMDTWVGGEWVRSTGHGFCGMSRQKLLEVFHARATRLGVKIHYGREITSLAELGPADLVLGSDGVHSIVRDAYAETFKPSIDWRRCKFTWLGTDMPLEAFTFIFKENEHGLFQVHAYPFERNLSTFIVECREEVWQRAGLDQADEAQTVAYCTELFGEFLGGHRLLTNKSIWRTFPTISCERWHHENIVLLGDAAHTAHFSIGSGTKLAMEDAIVLVECFRELGVEDVPAVLREYDERRRPDVIRLQRAAQTSLEWFENSARYIDQPPRQFVFNLMTRSKRITYDNLRLRDPDLVDEHTRAFAAARQVPAGPNGVIPPPAFTPLHVRDLELAHRIVVSPMCQYRAVEGTPQPWHRVHLGSFGTGGAALTFTEMTNVEAAGRITHGCAGIYTDEQEAAWKEIVDFVHANGPGAIGMQIAHAGRKASCNLPWEGDDPLRGETAWETIAPSAIPFGEGWPTPRAMDAEDLERTRAAFVDGARRAVRAGFDAIELHMAHGYLLSSFLSPLSNRRTDAYGGDLAGRARFPLEVLRAVRAEVPQGFPLFVRISASDWMDDAGGFTLDEAVELTRWLGEAGCDVVDVSSAGNVPDSPVQYGRMYQVPFAERIKAETDVTVMAVGGIQGADHANTIIGAGRADLCAIARGHLLAPHLSLFEAARYRVQLPNWPAPYLAVRPGEPRARGRAFAALRRPRIRHASEGQS